MATYSASLYQFKQALQAQGVYTSIWRELPGDVADPVRVAWETQDTPVDISGVLSAFVQAKLSYTTAQMQNLFLLAQTFSATGAVTPYFSTLYQFKQALVTQAVYTTVWQAISGDVDDDVRIAWESQDTYVDIDGVLATFVKSELAYSTAQMQALFLLAQTYRESLIPTDGLITDYSSLKSAIADWSARSDIGMRIPMFIRMFESQFSRDNNLQQMYVKSAALTPDTDGAVTLPTDVANWDQFIWSNGGISGKLEIISPAWAASIDQTTGLVPRYCYIQNGKLYVSPNGPCDVTISYYQKLPNLSISSPTNWLIDEAPEVYLWGSLVQVATFTQDAEGYSLWNGKYQEALESLTTTDSGRWSGAAMRAVGVGP